MLEAHMAGAVDQHAENDATDDPVVVAAKSSGWHFKKDCARLNFALKS
jgi:hypothetical protein